MALWRDGAFAVRHINSRAHAAAAANWTRKAATLACQAGEEKEREKKRAETPSSLCWAGGLYLSFWEERKEKKKECLTCSM